jgi:hypothetical protein
MTRRALDEGVGGNVSNYGVISNHWDGERIVSVSYRGTVVVTFKNVNGYRWAELNNGGWQTLTTKNVINAALAGAGSRYTVFQRDFEWYVDAYPEWESEREYSNGMTLSMAEAAA